MSPEKFRDYMEKVKEAGGMVTKEAFINRRSESATHSIAAAAAEAFAALPIGGGAQFDVNAGGGRGRQMFDPSGNPIDDPPLACDVEPGADDKISYPPSIEETLGERDERYDGKPFLDRAHLCQSLKRRVRASEGWKELGDQHKEALDMIFHKVARIVEGDPNYADSWHDIAGYALLIEREIG